MRILAVGDVVAENGLVRIKQSLPKLKREKSIDLCIVNGENSAGGRGITKDAYDIIMSYGADIITMGNHTWDNYQVNQLLNDSNSIIRPANYPERVEGCGYAELDLGRESACVINVLGRVGMEPLDCPFRAVDDILKKVQSKIIIVDFHAEATSEKCAMGMYLDGRVSAVFGTHTHVMTADDRILPKGTGYITDIGMTGVINSVIGMKPETSLSRFLDKKPHKYEAAVGETMLNAVIFDINSAGRCESVERIVIK